MPGMRTLLTIWILGVFALVGVATFSGCASQPAQSASAPSRETAIAFASAVAALEVLDALHAQRMAAMTEPTAEQVAWATAYSDRLHRLRDVLVIARSWLEGTAEDREGRAAFRDAAEVLQIIVDDMKSQSIEIPKAVDVGLAAAKFII